MTHQYTTISFVSFPRHPVGGKYHPSFNQNSILGTLNQKLPEADFKSCLEQCHDFLLEELEPHFLLRDKKVAHIFKPIRKAVEEMTNRKAKNEVVQKHLMEQTEEIIRLVLERFKEDGFIHKYLFPNTTEFQNTGKYMYIDLY